MELRRGESKDDGAVDWISRRRGELTAAISSTQRQLDSNTGIALVQKPEADDAIRQLKPPPSPSSISRSKQLKTKQKAHR